MSPHRFVLLAFPRRWRDEHESALLATLEESAGERSAWVSVIDVVRAGLSERRRDHRARRTPGRTRRMARQDVGCQEGSFQPAVRQATKRYLALGVVLVVGCGALGVSYGLTGAHHATAALVVQDPLQNETVGNDTTSANYVADQVAIMKLPTVVGSAAAQLSEQSGVRLTRSQFLSKLTVTNGGKNVLVTITFRYIIPLVAQVGANAELRAYETEVRTSLPARIEATITNIDQTVANLSSGGQPIIAGSGSDQLRRQLLAERAKVVALRAEVGAHASTDLGVVAWGGTDLGISAISPAALPTKPSRTTTGWLGLIGAVAGLSLSGLDTYRPSPRGWKGTRQGAPGVGTA